MNQNQRPPHAVNIVTPGAWSWVETPPRYARSMPWSAAFAVWAGDRLVARTAAWSSCCCFHKICHLPPAVSLHSFLVLKETEAQA
jgi:hypothetical protein